MHQVDGKLGKVTIVVKKCVVRDRPSLTKDNETIRITNNNTVIIGGPKQTIVSTKQKIKSAKQPNPTTFTFSYAFEETITPAEVYEKCVRKLVQMAVGGSKTMCVNHLFIEQSSQSLLTPNLNINEEGVLELVVKQLLQLLSERTKTHLRLYLSWTQFNAKGDILTDVLNDRQELVLLQDKKDNVQIAGFSEKIVESSNDLKDAIEIGQSDITEKSTHRSSFLHLSIKNGNNLHGRISFCELFRTESIPSSTTANHNARKTETQKESTFQFFRDKITNMNQGRVRIQTKPTRLGLYVKQLYKKSDKTLMIVNFQSNPKHSDGSIRIIDEAFKFQQSIKLISKNSVLGAPIIKKPINAVHTASILIEESKEEAGLLTYRKTTDRNGKYLSKKDGYSKSLKMTMRPNTLRLVAKGAHRFSKPQSENPYSQLSNTEKIQSRTTKELPLKTSNGVNQKKIANILKTEEEQQLIVQQQPFNQSQPEITQKYHTTELLLIEDQKDYYTSKQPEESTDLLFLVPELCESIYKTTIEAVPLCDDLLIPSTFNNQFEWSKVVGQFDNWRPDKQKGSVYFSEAQQFLLDKLCEEEQSLGYLHSEIISKEVETIKGQIQLTRRLQKNRGDCDPLEYIDTVELAIEIKVENLLRLKQQLKSFRQHIGQLQRCQQKLQKASNNVFDIKDKEIEEESLI